MVAKMREEEYCALQWLLLTPPKNGWSCTAKTKDKNCIHNPNGEFKRVEDGRAYANRKKITLMQMKTHTHNTTKRNE